MENEEETKTYKDEEVDSEKYDLEKKKIKFNFSYLRNNNNLLSLCKQQGVEPTNLQINFPLL